MNATYVPDAHEGSGIIVESDCELSHRYGLQSIYHVLLTTKHLSSQHDSWYLYKSSTSYTKVEDLGFQVILAWMQ